MARYDVAIVGAGPAGSAAAITLRQRYPAISVALLEGSQFDTPRLGEILSPAAAGLLAQLGVAGAVEESFRRVYGAAVSWGRPVLAQSPHLFAFHGPGWHVDRARFDALLARQAEQNGANVRCGARVGRVEREAEGWRFQLGFGTLEARFAIDATGRAAILARAAGARIVGVDRLTAFSCFLEAARDDDPLTTIEAVENGWWYSGALDDGSRVMAFLTDADIGRALQLAVRDHWLNQLRQTIFLRRAEGPILHGPIVRSAMSQHAEPVCGSDWLAGGDAAMALDPLSGQGIVAALRSGIFAAYAAGDWLSRGDGAGLARCRLFADRTRRGYSRSQAAYYAEERRWSECEFWKRRLRPAAAGV
jgi:flavin-dependent dehydrogenase